MNKAYYSSKTLFNTQKNTYLNEINVNNTFNEFFKNTYEDNLKSVLVVVNTKPKTGKYSIYQLQRNAVKNQLSKSGNLKEGSVYHNWMKKKLVGNETVSIPVDNKPKLSGDYIYICDISTNGRGGYKTGGKYCGISVNDLKGHEVVFQQVYGPAKFIAAHERFRNGNWKVTYKGTLRALRLKDIRKTNKSTHINFTVNGTNEQYDKSVTKVRVYKKALRAKMPNDQEARELVRMQGILKRSESISKVFIYTEAGKTKIAAITTRGLYILENQGYDNWRTTLRYKIKLKNVRMNTQFNGMQDVDNDGVRDIYFSTIDKKKGYNLLNLFLVKKNAIHTAYGKLGEAIGDFDPEVEFKFTSNTPKTVRPWLKKMIYQFGFVKKPREISESDPKDAVRFWVRDNGFLSSRNDLQLRLRMYNGDQDRNFVPVNKGVHPVTATITVNNVIYRSHYKGIVTAYDRNTNKSYVVYVPKTKRNFVTAFSSGNNKVFLGTQNDGIVILDKSSNVLKIFRHKKLKNKDIWKIVKKHNHYLVFTDSNKAVKVKAKKLER